jgi:hypothetical protein
MPYGERWRRQRHLFQKMFKKDVSLEYRSDQTRKVNDMLLSLLDDPTGFRDHIKAWSHCPQAQSKTKEKHVSYPSISSMPFPVSPPQLSCRSHTATISSQRQIPSSILSTPPPKSCSKPSFQALRSSMSSRCSASSHHGYQGLGSRRTLRRGENSHQG